MKFLQRLLAGSAFQAQAPERPRLRADSDPTLVYAIGDVHGCLDLLQRLEQLIVADAASFAGEKWLVTLGDYVDRGPQSAAVIDHLLAPAPADFHRLTLCGNHEAMMLDFLASPAERHPWLGLGGMETLHSYGIDAGALRSHSAKSFETILGSYIPQAHRSFLQDAPSLVETPSCVFVHAGLRPGVPLEQQGERDLLWYRAEAGTDYAAFGKTVIHGHTPLEHALVLPSRINVDTGAFATGRLTAVRLQNGKDPFLLSASATSSSASSN